jgi:hypothetical protein
LAVGFGLNIQAANHVIHFTRTWNPAKEDQDTDRAYRIGQTKDVYVYYPVVVAPDFTTFDAKLDELLNWKRELSRDMLNGAAELSSNEFGDLQDVGAATVGSVFLFAHSINVSPLTRVRVAQGTRKYRRGSSQAGGGDII